MEAAKSCSMPEQAQFAKSKVPCLFRHRGGNYYAVGKVFGRIKRWSLETDDFNTAKIRLPAVLEEMTAATAGKCERVYTAVYTQPFECIPSGAFSGIFWIPEIV